MLDLLDVPNLHLGLPGRASRVPWSYCPGPGVPGGAVFGRRPVVGNFGPPALDLGEWYEPGPGAPVLRTIDPRDDVPKLNRGERGVLVVEYCPGPGFSGAFGPFLDEFPNANCGVVENFAFSKDCVE